MSLKLLDLFCCQGGASMGYHQAGASDFPPGTKLTVTARIELPAEESL